jgi:hypothetical protein
MPNTAYGTPHAVSGRLNTVSCAVCAESVPMGGRAVPWRIRLKVGRWARRGIGNKKAEQLELGLIVCYVVWYLVA